MTSNEFMYDRSVRNKKGLYVFTSQTGTSHFVREAQKRFREEGYLTVAVSESEDTPLAKESMIFVNMGLSLIHIWNCDERRSRNTGRNTCGRDHHGDSK